MAVSVNLKVSKNPIGAILVGNEFEFGLFNAPGTGNPLQTAKNDKYGLVEFAPIQYTETGTHNYIIKEIAAPGGWETDDNEYPVKVTIVEVGEELYAEVEYPEGLPGFINTKEGGSCSLVEFAQLTFTEEGEYTYFIKELTPDGNGWETDKTVYEVVVKVVDDGYGNLIATLHYKDDEYPEFENIYEAKPVHVILSARKHAIGAELPCGRFEFALVDEHGKTIEVVKNA